MFRYGEIGKVGLEYVVDASAVGMRGSGGMNFAGGGHGQVGRRRLGGVGVDLLGRPGT